jgi:hypothetical protein
MLFMLLILNVEQEFSVNSPHFPFIKLTFQPELLLMSKVTHFLQLLKERKDSVTVDESDDFRLFDVIP